MTAKVEFEEALNDLILEFDGKLLPCEIQVILDDTDVKKVFELYREVGKKIALF